MRSTRQLYEDFHGDAARGAFRIGVKFGEHWLTDPGRANLIVPASLAVVGRLSAVVYETWRDGRFLRGIGHEFDKGSRPLLAAGPGRGQLFLIGDRYRFTERGIMDIGADGRLIEA